MATASISFQFQHPTFRLRHRHAVRSWLQQCAADEGKALGSLNFLFCDDPYMLEANRQFLQHDYLTDILTFPTPSALGIAGDILISIDRTRDNAKHHTTKPLDEIHRVMAHGVLHLVGYNDHTTEEQSVMRSQEDLWLNRRTF